MFMDIMRHDMEHFQEYWPFDVWIAVTRASNAELYCQPKQGVEQTVDFTVIWDDNVPSL